MKNHGDLPIVISNVRVFESTDTRQGAELTTSVDWLQFDFKDSDSASTLVPPDGIKELLLRVEVNNRKDDRVQQLGYRIIEIEHSGMETEPLQMFIEASLGEIEYVGGKFSRQNSMFLCIDFGSSNTSVAVAKKRILFENRSHSISQEIHSIGKKGRSISSKLYFKDKQPVDLEPTIDGVDNEHFIFLARKH